MSASAWGEQAKLVMVYHSLAEAMLIFANLRDLSLLGSIRALLPSCSGRRWWWCCWWLLLSFSSFPVSLSRQMMILAHPEKYNPNILGADSWFRDLYTLFG
ncbi:uncharacterized protein LOC109724976 [Ananas comosus]|uniref:Uncharacterized protein LOC109724976 n=1 Tax=Ananas comosus TaxID=4615 RepID=A0A6P5GNY1_ANACO|nr:uncharacterized protein LOC109724976 [Ananas comosus]